MERASEIKAGFDPEFLKKKPVVVRECLSTDKKQEWGVVVNLRTGIYYPINKTAHEIWHSINGKRTVGAIAVKIARKYGVKKTKAAGDVGNYILLLERAGLIRWRS